jgi:hypothetical protein
MSSDTIEERRVFRIIRTQVIHKIDSKALMNLVHDAIKTKYENVVVVGDSIRLQEKRRQLYYNVEPRGDFALATSTIEYSPDLGSMEIVDVYTRFFDEFDEVVNLTSHILTTFTVFVPEVNDEANAISILETYSQQLGKRRLGVGTVRGCIFSILESRDDDQYTKHYFVSPLKTTHNKPNGFNKVMDDVKDVAIHTARLSKLNMESRSFVSALKPGEIEISERTEAFLWNLMKPEPVELETLESWLGYIMEREASLSAMISSMRGNLIEAQGTVSRIHEIFRRLNEGSFGEEPSSLEGEAGVNDKVVKTYEDYLVRSEALKARLGTVMESVRTYLSIQQQKLTLEEQKASKEQLVRLVGLQEIFHKVEIFILAVYITEMARIIFEVVAEHDALLITAIFIPVALVISIVVTRLLHHE